MFKIILYFAISFHLIAAENHTQEEKINIFMEKYDINWDNRISQQEFPKRSDVKFRNFDKDYSGYITKRELRGDFKNNLNKSQTETLSFTAYDLNDDGIISRDELIGKHRKHFSAFDRNKDGVVSKIEFSKKVYGKMRPEKSTSVSSREILRSFNDFDSDFNGLISKDEMVWLQKNTPYFDTNKDEMLSFKEYLNLFRGKVYAQKYHKPGSFDYFDSNGDGTITKKELSKSKHLYFYKFDLNGNDLITKKEFSTVKEQYIQDQLQFMNETYLLD